MDELRSLNARFASFDRSPVRESAVRSFESQHAIELPSSHRRWLDEFGERAIAPHLVGGRILALANSTEDQVYRSFRGPLADEFPYTGTDPVSMAWDKDKDDYADQQPLRGTLCLGSAGCDEIWLLVVSGPERGNVWGFIPGLDQELQPTGKTGVEWSLERVERRIAQERRAIT